MYQIGQEVEAFDARQWISRSRDFEDNKQCWSNAKIIRIRKEYRTNIGSLYPILYDVEFEDGWISENHSPMAIRKKLAEVV